MNRKLLALAVGAALSLPVAAQAAPTLYGLLNLSVDMVDLDRVDDLTTTPVENDNNIQVNSNSSRIGVRGDEKLTSNLSAIYQVEWEVNADDAGPDLAARNRFLGLKSSFGTFKLGHFDSPLQEAQGGLDQFDDMTYADMGSYLVGENRMSNLIGYESPKIADAITVKLVLQPGEENDNDGIAEAMSASVAYEAGGLYAALAMDKDASNGAFAAASPASIVPQYPLYIGPRDTIRLVGTYTVDSMMFGAMAQTSEVSDEAALGGTAIDQTAFVLSGAYAMGKNTFKGQVAMVKDELSNGGGLSAEFETMFIGLGYDHNFTQMTKAYAQASMTTRELDTADYEAEDSVFSIGMQTKF